MPPDPPERLRVAEIAIDLFLARGFDEVTVGEIAEAAGISRRTMFRLFSAKEEIAFPDHEPRRRMHRELLEAAGPDEDPLDVLAAASERVLADFLAHRELVLKRYELTRADARVREREIVENAGYVQALRRWLRERYEQTPSTPPGAPEVVAAMLDAVHATVLRRWVRSGGTTDATAELREHFRWAIALLRSVPPAPGGEALAPAILAVLPATAESRAFVERVGALAREHEQR